MPQGKNGITISIVNWFQRSFGGNPRCDVVVHSGSNIAGDPVTTTRDIVLGNKLVEKGTKLFADYKRQEAFRGPYLDFVFAF